MVVGVWTAWTSWGEVETAFSEDGAGDMVGREGGEWRKEFLSMPIAESVEAV